LQFSNPGGRRAFCNRFRIFCHSKGHLASVAEWIHSFEVTIFRRTYATTSNDNPLGGPLAL
jgi:hypothetical protein